MRIILIYRFRKYVTLVFYIYRSILKDAAVVAATRGLSAIWCVKNFFYLRDFLLILYHILI